MVAKNQILKRIYFLGIDSKQRDVQRSWTFRREKSTLCSNASQGMILYKEIKKTQNHVDNE